MFRRLRLPVPVICLLLAASGILVMGAVPPGFVPYAQVPNCTSGALNFAMATGTFSCGAGGGAYGPKQATFALNTTVTIGAIP